ncbi:MAG: hypothetical protein ACRYFS_25320 [Janthinobacterium lividum]
MACQALMIITLSFVGATIAFLVTSFMIASNIQAGLQHHNHPPSPPSNTLLGLFYFAALIALLGSVFWTRFRSDVSSLAYKDFQQRTFIGLALANVSEYLGIVWVILGGAFALSVPLFAGSAAVILLFSLPSVLRRKSLLKQQSHYGS